MKYIFLVFLLLGLSACSLSNPFNKDADTVPDASVERVQVSDSGASHSGSSISSDSGTSVSSESGSVSVGTGAKTPVQNTDDMEKDPEVQSITDDLDKIFSDIENGGE